MASIDLEYNSGFQIYNSDGTPFHDLVLHKCTYETVVMSLGDKISGILYYKDNALDVTMSEYIIYKGVRYTLVNPPTILREGLVSDNSELRGMTKYSFTFYHPMYVLNNFPFSDIAVQSGQSRYLSQNKTFSWIGTLVDFVAKLNKNLEDTQWMVTIGNVTQEEQTKLSEVLSFDKNTIAEALKRGYETWEVPYVVDQVAAGTADYQSGKRFVVQYGLPTTEILDEYNQPFVFQMGQGVGLKNNSRNPKNNKIITRIAGYGSEDNIPYGYPQIPYYGGNVQYPLYYGIVGGQRVQLIKHPFTRNHLMPSVYSQSVYNKVNPKLPNGNNNPNYNPNIELVDYYDANDNTYTNRIKPNSPSYEIHEFGDIKPELGEKSIISAVPVSQQETQPDYKQKSDFLQEILDRISATEIEDEKTELLDVYDRVDRGLSYYEKHGEEGGDTYWFVFSITNDDYYEYVSYESSNYNFTATMLRDGSSAPTPDWDDSMDDDGKYLQSYFKITLPILEFDLYACAAITQEMKINMRSGACIGCTFPVEVDWDDYKRNFYNSDGEFDPDGEQRDYTKYPDSSSGQITVMVKKELETFGTLMPNQYQQPTTGDKFVVLGISLPNTYITSAEQRLDTDMKQYMRDNNVYYYDYPLKFDEHFLISHEDILSQMKNNVVVRFNYAGTEHALYIKQMSVKYNESPLPKYDITLTDDIEIVLNQIGQVTDEVSKLRLGFGAGGFGTVGAEYIRKDIDDTARGTIRMIKGMQVGERFVTGLLGEGGVFRKDSDGTTYLETDKLYVRMKAYFDTVEVKHYLHTGGNRIASQASGIVCSRVEMIDAYGGLAMDVSDAVLFRCFFKANDGDKTIRNDFMIGDLAFCRETNVDVSSVNLHGYWRLVIGRNVDGFLTENKEAWIDLSNRASDSVVVGGVEYRCAGYQNGSDAPIAQDDIIQLGNITDKDRQGAIVEYVGGEDAPSYQIFQGIGEDLPYPYTLEDKNYIGLGYSSQTGHAYMNVYGDVFIGAKPDAVTGESPTYIKYDSENEELTIKAVMEIIPTSTIGGETLEEYIQEHQTIYDDTDVLNAISDLENITDNLQDQIDGAIETLYGDVDPSVPANDPYRNYTTEEKENHLGDMYYNSTTGYAYRYDKGVEGGVTTYFWQLIRDSGITEAIAKAGDAVNLANTKGKIFTTADGVLPTPPYNINDLWVSAKGTWGNITYDNDIVKCVTARGVNATASISDWVKASKYTDDSSLQNFISFTYDPENAQLHKQIDGKIDTFFTEATEDPSSNWTTTALKEDHVDDVWYQTDTDRMFRYIKVENGGVTSYRWDEIYDELAKQAYRHAAIAQDTADGKRRVFVSQPQDSDAYDVGDLWVNASYTSGNEIIYDNDVLRCKEGKAAGDTFSISHWQKASKYTDDTDFNTFVQNTYSSDQANLQNQIDGKYETWFLNGVPTLNNAPAKTWTTIALKDEHVGDLYWDKKNLHAYRFVKDNQTYRWLQIGDNGVICAMADAANAQDTADNKRRVFLTQPTPPYDQGDLWTQGGSGDIMMCVTSRSSGSYNATDWAKASKYTNDALLLTFLDGYQGNLTTITNQVDAKLDTWVSSSDPSVRWTSNDLKELHVGDIWLNTNESTVSGVGSMKSAVYTKKNNAYSWVVDDTIPNSVFDTIDGKRSIYVTWQAWKNGNVNNLKERDLFIPASDTTQGGVTYKANKVYRCTSASQETFQEVAYTDDTKVNAIIAKYGQIMNIQAATANDIGEALGHLREVLGGSTSVDGGLVLTNAIYMKDTAATPSIWAGISGVYKTDETGTGYKGHGTASWYGGGVSNGIPIDHEVSPSASNYAKSLHRFDGSGYLASGNITWDKDGIVTIANVYSDVNGQPVPWSGATLQYITNLSTLLPITIQSGVTYLDPQVGFKQLSVLGETVATQAWVGNNYLSKTDASNTYLSKTDASNTYLSIAFFNAIFQLQDANGNAISPNNATTAKDRLKILVGAYTDQYLSALGLSNNSGGGTGDVTWEALASNSDTRQVALSHLTGALSGYATQSWVTSQGYTTNIGTVTQVKVGTTAYNPSNGVVSLPAYPTTLPASDVQAWAKATTKPSYTLDEVEDGATRKLIHWTDISDYTTAAANYTIFASVSSTSTSRYKDCIILLSGGGYYYSGNTLTGQWLIEMRSPRNSSVAIMKVICLIPPATNTTITFGHYTVDGVTYFGMKSTSRRGELGITTLLNNAGLFTVGKLSVVTEEPEGWTSVAYNTASLDVPSWAMAETKPSYTWSEIGSRPTALSQFTNDSGFITSSASITGNAATATKLQTPRTINGTSFDGSDNITTKNWGTARNISIADSDSANTGSAVSVNGSAAVTLKLPSTIKATLTGNADSATKLQTSRTLWGQTFDGTENVSGAITGATTISASSNVSVGGKLSVEGVATIQNYIDIDRTDYGSLPLGTQIPILRARSKNAETGTYSYNSVISTFGSGETGTTVNNFPVRLGSQTGATWISAGESGKTFSSVYTDMCNTEKLLLTSDDVIEFFSGLASNSSNYESRKILTINSSGLVIPSGKTLTIGDAVLSWDETNQGIKITKGLYSETFISALGAGSSGGGGGTGDVTWDLLANNSDTRQIALSHLTTALGTYATQSWVSQNFNNYVLPAATDSVLGGVKVGYTTSGKNYKVQLDSSSNAYVNVPWENTEYPSGTAELLTAGTDTTDRVWSAKILSKNVGGRQYYGTCSTAAATQTKVATIPASQNFRLAVGAIITIKFSNTNTFSATASDLITLNVNGTGAKQIWYNTSAANTGTNTTCYGYKNRHTTYIYDGTYWVWVSQGTDANTTYSAGTAALLTEGTNTTNRVWQAKILRDEFDKYLPLNGGTMTGSIIMGTNHYIRFFEGNNSWYIQAYDGRFSVGPNGSELSFDTSGNILARTFITTEKGALIGCDLNTPLRINCTKDNEDTVFLEFQMKSLSCGYYCAGTDKKPYFWDTSKKKIWYEGNDGASSGLDADLLDGQHGSYYATAASLGNYLPISGGTLIGNNATVLAVRNTSSATNNYIVIRCTNNGTSVDAAYFGHWGDGWGAFMQNPMATGVPIMGIDDNGTPYFSVSGIENKKTLFHTGNLTSLSQLTNDLTYVLDSVDSSHHITFSYRGAGLNDSDWFAAWNNTQLRAIGKSTVKSILGVSTIEGYFTNGEANRSRYLATWLNDMSGTYGDSYKFYVKWDTGSTLRLYCSNNNVDFDVRATAADKLVTGRTLWGQTFDGTGNVTGTISGTANIYPSATSSYDIGNSSLNYKYLWVNWIGSSNGSLEFGGANAYHMAILANGNVGIGTRSPSTKLHVEGNAKIGSSNGNFIEIGAVRLVYDSSNNAIKVVANDGSSAANFYATGAVSALGANTSSGGGGTLNQPLSAINTSGLSSPTVDGATLVWNSSKWVYSYQRSLLVHSLQTISGGIICYSTLDVNGVTTLKNTVTVNENIEMKRGKRIRFQQSASGVPEVSMYTSSSDYNLHLVAASIYANSTIISSSDMRLKDVEQYIERDISSIAQAPIFYYRWKKNPELGLHLGSSAQYWSNVFKYAVMDSGEGYLGLDYSTTALAAAVITARKVQNHEDRIAYLERENENLRNRIKQLEAA